MAMKTAPKKVTVTPTTKPAAKAAAKAAPAKPAPAPAKAAAKPAAAGMASRLAKMQKLWEGSAEAGPGGGSGPNENVPDGKQQLVLVGAAVVEVKNGEKLMVEWKYDAIEVGTDADRKANEAYGYVVTRDGLDTAQNLGYLKRRLRYFGLDADQVQAGELEEALKLIASGRPTVTGRVWTSADGQWQNVQLLGNSPDGWENDPFGSGEEEETLPEEAAGSELRTQLEAMSRDELKKFIAANNLGETVKVFKGETEEAIVLKILAAMEPEEEEAPAEEEEPAVEEEEAPAEEEAVAIEKGATVLYTPPRAKAALTCEVTDVDAKGTAKLKNLATNKLLAERVALDQLELAATEGEEELPPEEEEFGVVTKGSKVEAMVNGKPFKGTVAKEPQETDTTVSVKFEEGPFKGKTKDIPVEDIEPVAAE